VIVVMKKQLLIIMSVALTSFLIGTMFSTNYLAIGGKPNPIWEAIYDLQARVNSLNNTVIEQQAQISELQSNMASLNASHNELQLRVNALESLSGLPTPDFDSGWILSDGYDITIYHNLGTTRTLVYLVGRNSLSEPINGPFGMPETTLRWFSLNTTHITVFGRYGNKYVRIMLWRIAEP
jgi:hypothetical protein